MFYVCIVNSGISPQLGSSGIVKNMATSAAIMWEAGLLKHWDVKLFLSQIRVEVGIYFK